MNNEETTDKPDNQEAIKPGPSISEALSKLQEQATADGPRTTKPEGQKIPGKKRGPKPKAPLPVPLDPEAEKVKLQALAEAARGIFYGLSVGLGPHWELRPNPDQSKDQALILARSWMPIMNYYEVEPGVALLWVTAASVSIAIVGPRAQVTIQHKTGLFGKLSSWWKSRKSRKSSGAQVDTATS